MKKLLSLLLLSLCFSLGTVAQEQQRCKATTQKGTQCARVAKKDGYCTQHYNKVHPLIGNKRCKAITQKGTQCTREAKTNSYCTQHYKMVNATDTKVDGEPRCQSATKSGEQCKNNALPGMKYCPVHKIKHTDFK